MLPVLAHEVQLPVYLAQQVTTAAVVDSIGITESELLHDQQLNVSLEHGPGALSVSTTSVSLARILEKWTCTPGAC